MLQVVTASQEKKEKKKKKKKEKVEKREETKEEKKRKLCEGDTPSVKQLTTEKKPAELNPPQIATRESIMASSVDAPAKKKRLGPPTAAEYEAAPK